MEPVHTVEYSQVHEDSNGVSLAGIKEPPGAPLQTSRLAGKRVVSVLYSSFPSDPRPRRAAEALVKEGAVVEVICLKEDDEEPAHESFGGIEITRVPLKRRRGGKLSYLLQYGSFVLMTGAMLAGRALKKRYQLVHIHNMPDFLVFSALVPKILGAKVILDLHDPMPELMMTIFGLRSNSLAVRGLQILEKWSLGFADVVLTVNDACKKIFSARSCPAGKISVIMNSPEELVFQFHQPSSRDLVSSKTAKPFVMMYHGSLVERHGLDLAVMALKKARGALGNAELRIYGRSTPFLEKVMESVQKSELRDAVKYLGPKSLEQIAEAIGECDIGVIPNRRSIFTELNTPTRIFEYLSQGKPVIAPRAQGILDYFGPQELLFFTLGDADDLAMQMKYAFAHPKEMLTMVERGQDVYRAHQWSNERQRFLSVVDGLLKIGGRTEIQPERRAVSVGGRQE